MAKKKLDYNQKDAAELKKLSEEKREELFNARMDLASRKIKDVHILRKIRREIAAIKSAVSLKG
jgi:ribosomal protein L29